MQRCENLYRGFHPHIRDGHRPTSRHASDVKERRFFLAHYNVGRVGCVHRGGLDSGAVVSSISIEATGKLSWVGFRDIVDLGKLPQTRNLLISIQNVPKYTFPMGHIRGEVICSANALLLLHSSPEDRRLSQRALVSEHPRSENANPLYLGLGFIGQIRRGQRTSTADCINILRIRLLHLGFELLQPMCL